MHRLYRFIMFLPFASLSLFSLANESMTALERQGTQFRLSGDFASAKVIENELIKRYPQPAGHVFALNTIITQLTWDETQTAYDEALVDHAATTLKWCEPRVDDQDLGATANYYCGQANFVLSFHHALKGKYYQAGKRGTASIDYLETALSIDPSMIDAKMHLGVGYHVADNLPPFIKMFSRFLWFIPTGNSEKSLPYLLDVMKEGDQYQDVARYLYGILLLEDPSLRPEAVKQLTWLVSHYPANGRFQLRLISLLLIMNDFEGTLNAISNYLENGHRPAEGELSITKVLKARAHLGLNETDLAAKAFSEINSVFLPKRDGIPDWGVAWYLLTAGQLHDLDNRRDQAITAYRQLLSMAKDTYVSDPLIEAARAGISEAYRLPPG